MAGMRLGYALGRPELIAELRPHIMSWVNSVAVAAAISSVNDDEFVDFSRQKIIGGREIVSAAMREKRLESLPCSTNFVYKNLLEDTAPVRRALRNEGVFVGRPYQGFPTWLRVSMGGTEDLQQFAKVFAGSNYTHPSQTGMSSARSAQSFSAAFFNVASSLAKQNRMQVASGGRS